MKLKTILVFLIATLTAACGGGGGESKEGLQAAREQILKSIYCISCADVYVYVETNSYAEAFVDGNMYGSAGTEGGTVTTYVDDNGNPVAVKIDLPAKPTAPPFTVIVQPVPGGVMTTDNFNGSKIVPFGSMLYNYMSGSWQLKIKRPVKVDP